MDKAPDAFRTISEVADDLKVPQHVLRFWETRFPQIKPMKRGGGRRYYRPDDVDLLRGIRHLLYGEGYTIRGVQRLLKDNGLRFVQGIGRSDEAGALPEAREGADPGSEAVPEAAPEMVEVATEMVEPAPAFPSQGPAARVAPERRAGPAAPAPRPAPEPPAPAPAAARPPGLADEDRRRLQAALQELAECRRLIDAALKGE